MLKVLAATLAMFLVASCGSSEDLNGLIEAKAGPHYEEGEGTRRPVPIGETIVINFSKVKPLREDLRLERVEVVGLTENAEHVDTLVFDMSRAGEILAVDPPPEFLLPFEEFQFRQPHRIAVVIKRIAPGDVNSTGLRLIYSVDGKRGSSVVPYRVILVDDPTFPTEQ